MFESDSTAEETKLFLQQARASIDMALDADADVEEIIPHKNAKIIRNAAAVNNEVNKKLLTALAKYSLIEDELAYVNMAALDLDADSIAKFINIINNENLSIPFSDVMTNEGKKFNIITFFVEKSGLSKEFITKIADCAMNRHGKFELLFALLVKDASLPRKSDIQVIVDGKKSTIEVKAKDGKLISIDGSGTIGNDTKGFASEIRKKARTFQNKLFEKIKSTGINGDKDKKVGDEIIKNVKANLPVPNDDSVSIVLGPRGKYLSINSFIKRLNDLFFDTALKIEGETANSNEIKNHYKDVEDELIKFLLNTLDFIFKRIIDGSFSSKSYKNIIRRYINEQELGVDINGLTQTLGIEMLRKYKNDDKFRYFLICDAAGNASIFDLEKNFNEENIKNLIQFSTPGISPGSAGQGAAFGVALKK